MALKRWQKGLLHIAPDSLGVDDDERKLVQRNLGNAWSAADMDLAGFVRVMAFWEQRGWIDGRNGEGHWQRELDSLDVKPMRGKAVKLADVLGWTLPDGKVDFVRLDGFVARVTNHRRRHLRECDPKDLWQLIEALKAMIERNDSGRQSA